MKKATAKKENTSFDNRSIDQLVKDAKKSISPLWMKLHNANRAEHKVTLSASALSDLVNDINTLRGQIENAKEITPPYVGIGYTAIPTKDLERLQRYEKLFWDKCKVLDELKDSHEQQVSKLTNEATQAKVALSKEQRRFDNLWSKHFDAKEKIKELKKATA